MTLCYMGSVHLDLIIDVYVEEVSGEQFWSLRRDLEEVSGFSVDLHDQSDDPDFVSKIKKRGEIFYEV